FKALESLDDKTRAQVDAFARASIVDRHPEWIDQELAKAPVKNQEIALMEKGGKSPFGNGEKRQEILQLLDKAALKGETPDEAAQKLLKYSPNQENYFRIVVVKRIPQREIMTFAEADAQGVLDQLLDKELEAFYVKIRENNSSQYQK